jgi:hypothetical protein
MSTGTYAAGSASRSSSSRVLVLLPEPYSTSSARGPIAAAIAPAWRRRIPSSVRVG